MNNTPPIIKPIETRYNGCHFRSRTEARWAVYFDTIGIKYEYEKEGYDLGELGWYLPDFWLPEYQMFVEVKGDQFKAEEYDKCACLVANTPNIGCLLLEGLPDVKPYFGLINLNPSHIIVVDQETGKPYETDILSDDEPSYVYVSRDRQLYSFDKPVTLFHFILKNTQLSETQTIRTFPLCHINDELLDIPSLILAVNKSKSARFEHGETG